MISKKFKVLVCAILMIASVAESADNASAGPTKLPTLYYAGVVPVQWSKTGPWKDLGDVQKAIDAGFPEAVRGSRRFTVLNDDLVRSLWSTSNGRKELEADYEVSAYISLDVSSKGDLAVMTVRLLSPKLETRLQESDLVPTATLASATKAQISARLSDLVQRMINRLPIDAHITSINGAYVTLSGGSDQGLKVGQKFDIVDASVVAFHPVNGSWLKFNSVQTGSLEIIEVKSRTAIGKVSALAKDNAVKVGQGIRIEEISGRSRFVAGDTKQPSSAIAESQTTTAPSVSDTHAATNPPIPAATQPPQKAEVASKSEGTPSSDAATRDSTPAKQITTEDLSKNTPAQSTSAAVPATGPAAEQPSPSNKPADADHPKDAPPETDNFTARIMPKGSEMRTWAGMKMWSISGSASAKASLPVWLVNAVAADIYRNFSDTIDYNYGVDFGYGPTGNGSFFSYNLHSAGRWHMYMKDVLPGADDVNFGLMASMASANITGETSGGFDLTMVRFTMGVHGWAKPDFIGQKIEWTGEVFYPLYYSGQFGVKGKFREIVSGSSMAYRVGMYVGDRPAQGWQYGAAFDFESNSWSLKTGKKAEQSSIGLLALARRDL